MHSYNYEPSPVSFSVSSPLSVSQGYQRSNHFIATQGECEIPSNLTAKVRRGVVRSVRGRPADSMKMT